MVPSRVIRVRLVYTAIFQIPLPGHGVCLCHPHSLWPPDWHGYNRPVRYNPPRGESPWSRSEPGCLAVSPSTVGCARGTSSVRVFGRAMISPSSHTHTPPYHGFDSRLGQTVGDWRESTQKDLGTPLQKIMSLPSEMKPRYLLDHMANWIVRHQKEEPAMVLGGLLRILYSGLAGL